MKLGGYVLPEPNEYSIVSETRTTETVLVDGSRRYIKMPRKRTLVLHWVLIDKATKELIEELNSKEIPMLVELDTHTLWVVGYSDPEFRRVKGTQERYSCSWELREP
jgi:hypothetical protein